MAHNAVSEAPPEFSKVVSCTAVPGSIRISGQAIPMRAERNACKRVAVGKPWVAYRPFDCQLYHISLFPNPLTLGSRILILTTAFSKNTRPSHANDGWQTNALRVAPVIFRRHEVQGVTRARQPQNRP